MSFHFRVFKSHIFLCNFLKFMHSSIDQFIRKWLILLCPHSKYANRTLSRCKKASKWSAWLKLWWTNCCRQFTTCLRSSNSLYFLACKRLFNVILKTFTFRLWCMCLFAIKSLIFQDKRLLDWSYLIFHFHIFFFNHVKMWVSNIAFCFVSHSKTW